MGQKTLLVIDDNRAFAEFLKSFIEEQCGLTVLGVAGSGEEGLHLAETLRPAGVIVDLKMPGLSGLETIRRLRAQNEKLRILAVSMWNASQYVTAALGQGANGFVPKTSLSRDLIPALQDLFASLPPE